MIGRPATLAELAGIDLGTRTIRYQRRDAILYALAVGAQAEQLELVYERALRVLPMYATALGLWAVQAAGRLRVYQPERSLHTFQRLRMRKPLPPAGRIPMRARIANVFDKGSAAIVEIDVSSEHFELRYGIFLPGRGGWGGPPGSPRQRHELRPAFYAAHATDPQRAALYRLTGDRHPIHIDPAVARANGFQRPILHGLCTLGIAARELAAAVPAHPAELWELDARVTAPVTPGETIELAADAADDSAVRFQARVAQTLVLADGRAAFRQ
jgi:acyl dehydratase